MPDDFDEVGISMEDLNPEVEEEPEKEKPVEMAFGIPDAPPKNGPGPRVRSGLDDLIAAVQGIPLRKPRTNTCPKCGSTNVERRGGLMGGTLFLKCRAIGCRSETPIATLRPFFTPPEGFVGSSTPVHPGPYDGEVRPAPVPFTPMFKRKS